jgi:uracil-DNA glycosylase
VSNAALIPLVKGRTQVVYGVGPPDADLMFVGKAPGKDDDENGEPLVGKGVGQAGRLLDERLGEIGIDRAQVYLINIVIVPPNQAREGSVTSQPRGTH